MTYEEKIANNIAPYVLNAKPAGTPRERASLVCPCTCCRLDYEKGRPMRIARMRAVGGFPEGLYWLAMRLERKMYANIHGATYFGPSHTAELAENKSTFVIEEPAKQPPRWRAA